MFATRLPPPSAQEEKRNEKIVELSLPPNGGLRLRLHRWFYGGSMTDREIMQQALKALEQYVDVVTSGNEPDAWITVVDAGKPAREAITALRERLAQPEQEPVACVTVEQLSKMAESTEGIDSTQPGYQWRKGWNDALRRAMAYAAPKPRREWQVLTEEEIVRICTECWRITPSDIFYARAIEAKLKAKNDY